MALGVGIGPASLVGALVFQLGFLATLLPLLAPVSLKPSVGPPQPPVLPPPVEAVCPLPEPVECGSSQLQLWATGIVGLLCGYGLAVITFVTVGGLASIGVSALLGGVVHRLWGGVDERDLVIQRSHHDDGTPQRRNPATQYFGFESGGSPASEDSW